MSISKTILFIYNHPLNKKKPIQAILRFFNWQIRARLSNKPKIYSFTEKSKLLIKRGMTGATGNLYCGLLEFEDMSFLLHFLRPEDLFVDIGANVGAYTILSSAHVRAKTIAFEPVPSTYQNLIQNLELNNILEKTIVNNIALGSKSGTIQFTNAYDTINHVAHEYDVDTITVQIDTLDNMLKSETPIMIKIDVEGFETEVLCGGKNTLQDKQLKVIIIEINGVGKKFGFDEQEIHKILIDNGFEPYSYSPVSRSISPLKTYGPVNTIYLRDLDFIKKRLLTAPKFRVLNQEL